MSNGKDKPLRPVQRLLDVTHVMERLAVSRATAYRVMNCLPGRVYIGSSGKRQLIRVPEIALEAFIAAGGNTAEGNAQQPSIFRPSTTPEPMLNAPSDDAVRNQRTRHWLKKLRDDLKPKPPGGKPQSTK